MKCFYHSADLDGHCSGAIVKMKYPECEMIGINYGDAFPWSKINPSEKLFMCDFSLQPFQKMAKLAELIGMNLIWIDHHKSAMDEHEQWNSDHPAYLAIDGIRKDGIGACQLVWESLYVDRIIPTFIKLLAEYDVWNHTDPRTLSFQYGMRQFKDTYPLNQDLWQSLFDVEEVHRITEVGGIIIEYQDSENGKYCRARSFDVEIDGLKCIALNKGLTNSKVFDSVWDPEKYDAMMTFCLMSPDKGWTISLYTDKPSVDVSIIAKNRGGGGHKQAAGFQCAELPF